MTKLTPREIKTAAKILKKSASIPRMPRELFEVYVSKGVNVIVELVIFNKVGKILLTWRDDKFYHGWHIPGGFMGVGETLEQAAQRIAKREIGRRVTNLKFTSLLNYRDQDPRSHSFCILHTCRAEKAPKNGRFFSVAEMKKLPKNDLLYHVPMILKLIKRW